MTKRDELVTGLHELKERLERVAFKPTTTRSETLACGYVVGFILDMLPKLEAVDPAVIESALARTLLSFGKDPEDA